MLPSVGSHMETSTFLSSATRDAPTGVNNETQGPWGIQGDTPIDIAATNSEVVAFFELEAVRMQELASAMCARDVQLLCDRECVCRLVILSDEQIRWGRVYMAFYGTGSFDKGESEADAVSEQQCLLCDSACQQHWEIVASARSSQKQYPSKLFCHGVATVSACGDVNSSPIISGVSLYGTLSDATSFSPTSKPNELGVVSGSIQRLVAPSAVCATADSRIVRGLQSNCDGRHLDYDAVAHKLHPPDDLCGRHYNDEPVEAAGLTDYAYPSRNSVNGSLDRGGCSWASLGRWQRITCVLLFFYTCSLLMIVSVDGGRSLVHDNVRPHRVINRRLTDDVLAFAQLAAQCTGVWVGGVLCVLSLHTVRGPHALVLLSFVLAAVVMPWGGSWGMLERRICGGAALGLAPLALILLLMRDLGMTLAVALIAIAMLTGWWLVVGLEWIVQVQGYPSPFSFSFVNWVIMTCIGVIITVSLVCVAPPFVSGGDTPVNSMQGCLSRLLHVIQDRITVLYLLRAASTSALLASVAVILQSSISTVVTTGSNATMSSDAVVVTHAISSPTSSGLTLSVLITWCLCFVPRFEPWDNRLAALPVVAALSVAWATYRLIDKRFTTAIMGITGVALSMVLSRFLRFVVSTCSRGYRQKAMLTGVALDGIDETEIPLMGPVSPATNSTGCRCHAPNEEHLVALLVPVIITMGMAATTSVAAIGTIILFPASPSVVEARVGAVVLFLCGVAVIVDLVDVIFWSVLQ